MLTTEDDSICSYSLLPNERMQISLDSAYAVVDFIEHTATKIGDIEITLKGGEPLLMPIEFYRLVLPVFRRSFGHRLKLFMQSNLLTLSEQMIEIIFEYNIKIIAELDGYKEMCDFRRGVDYFEKVMGSIRRLRENGIDVSCICTFTSAFKDQAKEVYEFFAQQGLSYIIEFSQNQIGYEKNNSNVSDEDISKILFDTLEIYKEKTDVGRVKTIDKMAEFVALNKNYNEFNSFKSALTIREDGKMFDCEKLIYKEEYAVNDIFKKEINKSESKQLLNENELKVYGPVFDMLKNDLLNKDPAVLAMAGQTAHPNEKRMNLYNRKWALRFQSAKAPDYIHKNILNELYLNIDKEQGQVFELMQTASIIDALYQAQECGFCKVIIEGNSPLCHNDIENILHELSYIDLRGMELILKTDFRNLIEEKLLKKACKVFTKIIVNIDGDMACHDKKHGQGAYDNAVLNLIKINELGFIDKISIASNLSKSQREGYEGAAAAKLAKMLKIKEINLYPQLPLDCADPDEKEDGFICLSDSDIVSPFSIKYTCGIGQNLYIEPNGDIYPCSALKSKDWKLGNISDSINSIVQSEPFKELWQHHVDTNKKCKHCNVRYLCGGLCKAWSIDKTDLDSDDFDCSKRQENYLRLAEMIDKRWS